MENPPTWSCFEQRVHGGVEPVHDRAAPFLAFDEVGVLQGLEVVCDGARVAVQAGGEASTVGFPVLGERVEDAGLRGFGERREERQGVVPIGEKAALTESFSGDYQVVVREDAGVVAGGGVGDAHDFRELRERPARRGVDRVEECASGGMLEGGVAAVRRAGHLGRTHISA